MEAIFFFSAKQTHVSHLTDAPIIAIKAFERTFYPIHTSLTAAQLNHGHWSAEQLEAALLGWMFGWDAPGARPAVKAVVAFETQSASGGQRKNPAEPKSPARVYPLTKRT